MSQQPWDNTGRERWAARVQTAAREFAYPPTPDLTALVRQRLEAPAAAGQRRLAWALVILVLLAGLLAVPQVRAAVVEFLQVGAVRIFLAGPTPTPTLPPATPRPAATATPSPAPSPTPLASVLDLAGQTTLAQAQTEVDFPIRLPAYPPGLGQPHLVFLQDMGGPVVILVWLDPDQAGRVKLSLHELGPGTFAEKGQPRLVQETTVNGQPAYWMEGPYIIQFRRGNRTETDLRRLVEGHVLVWAEGQVTYRLETDLPLAEAVKIAESLQ